ncbi:MAG: tRNA-dihydrouridine synthase [Myxococcales bacterium]|nr:tRNA-dihydrouridine synthase [Myxococcales bacterium]
MVAVHWRTRADLYGGVRELRTIAAVKERLSIPVLANGDVIDEASALSTLRETGCDGLMIGRGAIRDPWVFLKVRAALAGEPPVRVDVLERQRVLLAYYRVIEDLSHSEKGALGRMKKIARYFADGVPDGEALKRSIFHSHAVDEVFDNVRAHFQRLVTLPAEVG